MLKIFLARHGQDLDNVNGILNGRRDQPLSEKGVVQAHEVAQKIRDSGIIFDMVYASPLQRAFRTAEIITEILEISGPEVMEDLIERDFGIMTGQPREKIEELAGGNVLKTEMITYFLDPPGAENFDQLKIRGNKVIDFVKAKHSEGKILLVTHGDIGKMIYAAYYNLEWEKVLRLFHFGNSELLELSPESSPENTHVFTIKQFNS
jgi:probable phosphoglycerate mutase